MSYKAFHLLFPAIAELETRSITIVDGSAFNLPPGTYTFLEMYCDEPGCDCRRAFFAVTSSRENNMLAVIAWGWETRKFYMEWMGDNDPSTIDGLIGPILNLASPQSDSAPALLNLFRNVLLKDPAYIDRIKRHYAMFRKEIDKKRRPRGRGKSRFKKR